MHNQQSFAPSFQPTAQAQYQGSPSRYQPTGPVQSYYQRTGLSTQSGAAGNYHMAHYQGNQPGHDQYLRADSTQPSSGFGQSQSGMNASYQMSNYRGDEPGHDQYLRADSTQPSSGFGQSAMQSSFQSQFSQPQLHSQPDQTVSYQMSNYRGNQPGHDQYLRADSTRPSSFGQHHQTGYR